MPHGDEIPSVMPAGWWRCRSPETVHPCYRLITLHCHDQCVCVFFNFATFLATLQYVNTFFCCSRKAASSSGLTEAHLNLQPVPGPSSEAAAYTECLLGGPHTPGPRPFLRAHVGAAADLWEDGAPGPGDGTGVLLWPRWPRRCLVTDLGPGLEGRSAQARPRCPALLSLVQFSGLRSP